MICPLTNRWRYYQFKYIYYWYFNVIISIIFQHGKRSKENKSWSQRAPILYDQGMAFQKWQVPIYKKIYSEFFCAQLYNRLINFFVRRFLSLCKRISAEENRTFYIDMHGLSPDEYLKNYVLGTRQYVCKEDPSTLPRARKLNKM